MKYLLFIITLTVAVMVQVSFFPLIFENGTWPNLLLLFILALRFLGKVRPAVAGALIGGSFLDLTQTTALGASSFLLILILFVSLLITQRIRFHNSQIFIFTYLSSFGLRIFYAFPHLNFSNLLLAALLDALLILIIFPLLRWGYFLFLGRDSLEVSFRE